jgi:ssDNA thymidine ADP-ribosyltransferase, DarT
MSKDLNPEKALIFRIVHQDNLPWILRNGLHCKNSSTTDPNYINIGNSELIDKRSHRKIPHHPGGTLSDYIPLYFTPFSPMLYNIKTGYGGIRRRSNGEIAILVSSLHNLSAKNVPFLFTDRHAYLALAQFYADLAKLDQIDWSLLQKRDFRRSDEDPGKLERYQAEALVHRHMPTSALMGVVCHSQGDVSGLTKLVEECGLTLQVIARPGWYF